MYADVAGVVQLQQPVAERRKARWSGAEGRRTEPAGPRPGLYRGSVHERPGFRPRSCSSPWSSDSTNTPAEALPVQQCEHPGPGWL